ncbi:MAG: NAD-dependent epimerase/dehydratase family protein [Phototrophicaceae bacterium]
MGTYLVSGSMGCLGAWALYHLVQAGENVISFDLSENRSRLDLLMGADEQAAITFIIGDLTNAEQVKRAVIDNGVTHVIHLAALQVPLVRANPIVGAQVNVTGTVNIFEAAKAAGLKHVSYASSIAVYGKPNEYPDGLIGHDAPHKPSTLYGVFKSANEGTARVYFNESGITSTALRPYTVYGLGRDTGLTSEPTKAMLAAAQGQDFHLTYGGKTQMHFASDTAKQFILAADEPLNGAYAFNMGGDVVHMSDIAAAIVQQRPAVKITFDDKQLPFPEGFDDSVLRQHFSTVYETPLAEGVAQTMRGNLL